ncbi:S-layer homology domain-containing protein [Dialister micraerophilus]|uniref:S-layer homology domain-containing protein n=1 Tax=Dialister micraerophilus TaxID=309120 RepID=UPI0023F54C4B|nr:S-layer homology domain-containing protein [Dialister micraerophilus]
MKKILALAAVAALTAGVSAYAANPFSDVSTDHWAYQAVADLSAQGVVEGYPNGTFQGEKHITRYEVAQIVARLLAQESQLNAQQKATVEKLAAEYADELSNLGVRVSNLENKVGNVTWTGDARVQFQRHVKMDKNDARGVAADVAKKDEYTGRVRLNLKAQANPQITVKSQLEADTDFQSNAEFGTVSVNKLHAEYAPVAGLTIDAGRTDATLGNGAFYDSDFNGVVASYDMGKFDVQAGYGLFADFSKKFNQDYKVAAKADKADDVAGTKHNFTKDSKALFVQGHAKVMDKVTLGAFYTQFEKADAQKDASEFAGVNANVQLTDALSLDGEYVRNLAKQADTADHKPHLWAAGATYDFGMAQLGVHYYDVERGAYFGGTTAAFSDIFENVDGARFWVASGEVALAKDLSLKANYSFNAKTQKLGAAGQDAKDKDLQNVWNVSLNYAF